MDAADDSPESHVYRGCKKGRSEKEKDILNRENKHRICSVVRSGSTDVTDNFNFTRKLVSNVRPVETSSIRTESSDRKCKAEPSFCSVELPKVECCGSDKKYQKDDCCWERGNVFPKIVTPSIRLKLAHVVYSEKSLSHKKGK